MTRKRKEKTPAAFWNAHNKNFLIQRLTEEWDVARRAEKRHEVAKQVLDAGKMVGRTLLYLALIGGAVTIAAVAPNVLSVFVGVGRHRRFFRQKEVRRHLYTFKQNNLFAITKLGENHYRVSLTAQGEKRALREGLDRLHLKRAHQWDGVWRLVIFDIPRDYNHLRDMVRHRLRMIGMEQLQESVFIYPYPCEEEVRFITSLYNASRYIRYLQASVVEGVVFDSKEGCMHIGQF